MRRPTWVAAPFEHLHPGDGDGDATDRVAQGPGRTGEHLPVDVAGRGPDVHEREQRHREVAEE
ncbi:MAG TPA: hypothetical protein VD859_10100, partial [Nocardioides sp.]|nr:hypothetical protein [Nocardioides sp.]